MFGVYRGQNQNQFIIGNFFSWIAHTVTIKYTKPRMFNYVIKHRKLD